jgi:hypothetical protein
MHRGTTRPAGSHYGKKGGRDRAPLSSWPLSLTLAMAAALAVLAALLVHEGRAPALAAQVPGGAPSVDVGHRPGPGLRHDGAQHRTLRRDVGYHQRRIGHLSMRPAGARPRQKHATLQIGTASPEARHTTEPLFGTWLQDTRATMLARPWWPWKWTTLRFERVTILLQALVVPAAIIPGVNRRAATRHAALFIVAHEPRLQAPCH